MFAGGALGRMAIFALNVMPYISASIIMQLMTPMSPQLGAAQEGRRDRPQEINQYTRYGTVVLAAMQAYGIAVGLEGIGQWAWWIRGWFFRISTVITLTGGTVFLMWLGEQITAARHRQRHLADHLCRHRGQAAGRHRRHAGTGPHGRAVIAALHHPRAVAVMAVAVIAFIVFMERAQRRIVVQYPKRQVGNKMFQRRASHLPLKLNTAGVIPPIFASSPAADAD